MPIMVAGRRLDGSVNEAIFGSSEIGEGCVRKLRLDVECGDERSKDRQGGTEGSVSVLER